MKILQNRKLAIVFFVVIVIVFTLLGSHRSLSQLTVQMEDAFFNKEVLSERRAELLDAQKKGFDELGSYTLAMEGYYSAPAAHLNDCVNYANRILSLIKDDVSEDSYNEIYESRRALIAALESMDISDIYDAQAQLYEYIMQLDENIVTNNHDDFISVRNDFINADNTAKDSGYNQCVDYFIATEMNVFPANILRRLTSVDMPEKFE